MRCAGRCNLVPTSLRCFLAVESVSAVVLPACLIENNGSLEHKWSVVSMVFIAATGQIAPSPKAGITIVLVSFLSCNVFDHISKTVTPLQRCLVTSNAVDVCGGIFEILRDEKKAKVFIK